MTSRVGAFQSGIQDMLAVLGMLGVAMATVVVMEQGKTAEGEAVRVSDQSEPGEPLPVGLPDGRSAVPERAGETMQGLAAGDPPGRTTTEEGQPGDGGAAGLTPTTCGGSADMVRGEDRRAEDARLSRGVIEIAYEGEPPVLTQAVGPFGVTLFADGQPLFRIPGTDPVDLANVRLVALG